MRYTLLLFASVGSLLVLPGCASASSVRRQTPPLVQTTGVPALPTRSPATATPVKRQSPLLPETGAAQVTVQKKATKPPAAPTPTPLPPTKQPPTPTDQPAPAIPTRLLIPAINLDVPVVAMGWSIVEQDGQQVSEWDVPNWRAAGWLNTSAPVGVPGNTVLEGHQDIDGRVFENLDSLRQGDEIQVQTASQTRKYIVVLRTIVPEKNQPPAVQHENARWIGLSNDERLTLVTCWPRNDNTHRLILVALPTH